MNKVIIQFGAVCEEYTVPYAIARAINVLLGNSDRCVHAEIDTEFMETVKGE